MVGEKGECAKSKAGRYQGLNSDDYGIFVVLKSGEPNLCHRLRGEELVVIQDPECIDIGQSELTKQWLEFPVGLSRPNAPGYEPNFLLSGH